MHLLIANLETLKFSWQYCFFFSGVLISPHWDKKDFLFDGMIGFTLAFFFFLSSAFLSSSLKCGIKKTFTKTSPSLKDGGISLSPN